MKCPLCDESFTNETALRSHLGEAHGLFDEEGAPPPQVEPVAPVEPEQQHQPEGAAAPAAGWYTDPWGGSSLRYWDGMQWTGQTSPPQPAGVPAPPFGAAAEPGFSRQGSGRGVPRPIVLALVVSIVVFFGVVAFVINRGGSKPIAVPEAPTSSELTPGVTSGPDETTLMSLVLQPSELPGGFSVVQSPTVLKNSPPTPGCDSPFAANPVVEVATSYTYQPQVNGTEHGHVISYAAASPSASVEEAQKTWRAGPGLECLKQSEQQSLSDSFQRGSDSSIVSATATMGNPSLPLSGDEQIVTIQYRFAGGQATSTTEVYHLYNGRYEVTLLTNHCSCAGISFPDAQVVSGGINALASRLSALPNP